VSDGTYGARLRARVLQILNGGAQNLRGVALRAEGAYPGDIQKVLDDLVREGLVLQDGTSFVGWGNSAGAGSAPRGPRGGWESASAWEGIADPHPADYDWRYTRLTLGKLTRLVTRLSGQNGTVALFGARTLFPCLVRRGVDVTLFERNRSLLDELRLLGFTRGLVEHDLFDGIGDGQEKYDVVVADPPWYPVFYSAFLLRAAEILKKAGVVVLCVLPWLTRPGASEDRAQIVKFGLRVGLDLWDIRPGAIMYETPRFEEVALAAEGIRCSAWRRADLFCFRKVRKPPAGIIVERPRDEPEWDDYKVRKRKVKVRRCDVERVSRFSFCPVAGTSGVLPSVSRRARYRGRIDLWTSDNVAYSIEGVEVVREALGLVVCGKTPKVAAREAGLHQGLREEEVDSLSRLLSEVCSRNG